MRLMHYFFGSAIPMFAHIAILFYVCQRVSFWNEGKVDRARGNVQYIGEQVARGMEEMKGDVGEELRVTDRLTAQSSKLAEVLKRFAILEESVIELVRMDRNRESVRIETPMDVNEEIKRIVAASERKRKRRGKGKEKGQREQREQREQHRAELTERVATEAEAAPPTTTTTDVRRFTGRDSVYRNPLSKFSACSAREPAFVARKQIDDRPRTPTMPEVRLLGERSRLTSRSSGAREDSKRD